MRDIQSEHDSRGVDLDQVGIEGLRIPVAWDDGTTRQAGIATVGITVPLSASRRGTHMSRMVEVAHEYLASLDPRDLPRILKATADCLDASGANVSVALAIATQVRAPTTQALSWQAHDVTVAGHLHADSITIESQVASDVTSLCPCSKAISAYGAHNQRSKVSLTTIGSTEDPYPIDVATAVSLNTAVGSCPVYPLVKRPDERTITMQAYDNPAFVEDMARDLSLSLRRRGIAHRLHIRNLESIHSHDAVVSLAWARSGPT